MRKKTYKFLTVATIVFIMIFTYENVYGQQHPANQWDIHKDNYYQWTSWTEEQQKFYILGFSTGAWAMGSEIAFQSGHADLYRFTKDRLPDYNTRELHAIVQWVYTIHDLRKTPVYLILIRAEEFLELRRELYRREEE